MTWQESSVHANGPCCSSQRLDDRQTMNVDRWLRLIAGGFVAASVLLGIYVNQNFLWFTVFVGLNLFQSAFTNWCPMMAILRAAGVPDTSPGHPVETAATRA